MSVFITVQFGVACIAALFYLIGSKMEQFTDAIPLLKVKLKALVDTGESWINLQFGINADKQVAFVKDAIDSDHSGLGRTIGTFFGTVSLAPLIPT